MKLPIILSAMIAALAIPGSLATDAAAPAADATAAPADAGAAPADAAAAPAAEKKGKHKGKKRKHHHAHHEAGPEEGYKAPFDKDDHALAGIDGDKSRDMSPKAGPMEQPGQKMP